jgi:hypothetical protein
MHFGYVTDAGQPRADKLEYFCYSVSLLCGDDQFAWTTPGEENTNMRKSIIAGLMLCAAMGAGYAHALPKKPVGTAHRHSITKAETARSAEVSTQFRAPAHPVIHDCVHVAFPQCSRGLDGLNDGSFRSW